MRVHCQYENSSNVLHDRSEDMTRWRNDMEMLSSLLALCEGAIGHRCSQFPHLAIAVSPRLGVKNSSHAWLDGCNLQRKRLLAPTECHQRHPVRTEMMRDIYINSGTVATLYLLLWNDFCNPNRVLIMQLFFLMKLHSFEDKPTATRVKLEYSKEMVQFFFIKVML